jgi:hypothetical protein
MIFGNLFIFIILMKIHKDWKCWENQKAEFNYLDIMADRSRILTNRVRIRRNNQRKDVYLG